MNLIRLPSSLRVHSRIVALVTLVAAIGVTVWSYKHGVILAYGDAEAHLNIAKRVTGGLTPGYAQLGGIWLPLPHLLMAPLVSINFLWSSGIGGSIPSILAFVWLAVMLYRLAYLLTRNFVASYIAPLVVIVNPNTLYLASTPMTEILLLSTFASSVYFFTKWLIANKTQDLIVAAFFTLLATVSRYDGWALVCVEFALLVGVLLYRRRSYKEIEGTALTYGFVAFLGITLWLIWNKLIFGTFTYFSDSVYGSKEQQLFFLKNGYLPTYHDLWKSIIYFFEDIRLVVGLPVVILTLLGVYFFLKDNRHKNKRTAWALVLLAATPILFYVFSLYVGQASLILPTFAKPGAQYTLSNVRYGVQILFAVGIFVAYLAARWRSKLIVPLIAVVVLVQSFSFVASANVIVYNDGTGGLSSQKISKGPDAPYVEAYMRNHYDSGLVLMDDYRRPIGLVESGVPMNRFIGSGNKPYWNESFNDPGKYAKWVIVQKAETDAIWKNLKRKDLLSAEFSLVYSKGNLFVYKERSPSANFVVRSGQHLQLDSKPFTMRGANVYDALALDDQSLKALVNNLAASDFNTVRTWCFNHGGKLTDTDFKQLDTLLALSKQMDLRVICVGGNIYNDYGGPINFNATSSRQFFTDQAIIGDYKSQLRSLLKHRPTPNGQQLKDNPTILAWELLNEPRLEGVSNSDIVAKWVNDVGQYVSGIDQRHLISAGTEGFTSSYSGQKYNEQHGASIEDVCKLEVITLCSGHLYPKYLTDSRGRLSNSSPQNTLHNWRTISDKLNKPLYVGEVGYDATSDAKIGVSRAQFFISAKSAIDANRLDGALIWNVGNKVDSLFTLQYGDSASDRILDSWN